MVREALTPEILISLAPREAAARFIARRAEGLTSGEQQLLEAWLARDEAHRRMFDSADRAWQAFAHAQNDELLQAMRRHALAGQRRTATGWRPLAAAAAILLLVAASVIVLMPRSNPWTTRPASVASVQYLSARGEVKELRLPDGSSMTLDAESLALARFGDESRTVELQRGRAFFEVAPDRSRPFAVVAGGRRVAALGTRFDINLAAGDLTVTLLDGKVAVGSLDSSLKSIALEPGQQYVEHLGKAVVRTIGAAGENAVAWRNGLINFNDQTLAEAAEVMNRYSREQIVIREPTIGSMRLSGQFRAGETQRFAETAAEVHKLRPVRQGDRIELLRR